MPTNLLTTNTTAASSSDVTLADGERATLSIKDEKDGAVVYVEIKNDGGGYREFRQLGRHSSPMVVDGPCTFRVRRLAGPAIGVVRD